MILPILLIGGIIFLISSCGDSRTNMFDNRGTIFFSNNPAYSEIIGGQFRTPIEVLLSNALVFPDVTIIPSIKNDASFTYVISGNTSPSGSTHVILTLVVNVKNIVRNDDEVIEFRLLENDSVKVIYPEVFTLAIKKNS